MRRLVHPTGVWRWSASSDVVIRDPDGMRRGVWPSAVVLGHGSNHAFERDHDKGNEGGMVQPRHVRRFIDDYILAGIPSDREHWGEYLARRALADAGPSALSRLSALVRATRYRRQPLAGVVELNPRTRDYLRRERNEADGRDSASPLRVGDVLRVVSPRDLPDHHARVAGVVHALPPPPPPVTLDALARVREPLVVAYATTSRRDPDAVGANSDALRAIQAWEAGPVHDARGFAPGPVDADLVREAIRACMWWLPAPVVEFHDGGASATWDGLGSSGSLTHTSDSWEPLRTTYDAGRFAAPGRRVVVPVGDFAGALLPALQRAARGARARFVVPTTSCKILSVVHYSRTNGHPIPVVRLRD